MKKFCDPPAFSWPPYLEENDSPLDHMKFDEMTLDDLSSDQRLLLEYVLGISEGKANP